MIVVQLIIIAIIKYYCEFIANLRNVIKHTILSIIEITK